MYPRSFWLVGSQTVPQLRDTVVRTFLEEMELYQQRLNAANIKVLLCKKWRPSTMSYKFYNDAEIVFRSCDNPMKFKSLNLDGAALDEPVDIDEEIFLMLQGRLRARHTKHRFIVMAGNPSGKTNWVYQKFFESGDKDYKVVHTTTYDNSFLPDGYISNMENSYDADYARRYLQGEWGSFEGQVYKDFSYDKHVGNFRDTECKYHIAGFDDGYRNPACLLAVGVGADNEIYVKREFYKTDMTSRELANETVFINNKYNFNKIHCDPSGQNAIAEMRNVKLHAVDADNDIDSGVAKLKSMFRNDLVFIDKSCVNLVKELESYRYEKDRFTRNLTEKPIAKDNHACISGETIINTTCGDIPIKNLVGTEGHVYSYKNGEIVARKYRNVCKTGKVKTLKITLDDDKIMNVTPNHPFLLRGGDYIEAGNLNINDSLMPFHYNVDTHGHALIYNTNGKREYAHRLVYRTINNYLPEDGWKWNIHHKDENKLNNNPSNLMLVTRSEHCKIHATNRKTSEKTKYKLRAEMIRRNKSNEWKKRNLSHLNSIRYLASNWHNSKEGIEWHKKHGKECWDKKHREKKTVEKNCLECNKEFITKDGTGLYCSNNCKAKHNRNIRKEIYGMCDTKRYSLIKNGTFNHRIKSIEEGNIEDVYNLYVDDTNNFACNNVITHNCDALRYAVSEFNPYKKPRLLRAGSWKKRW